MSLSSCPSPALCHVAVGVAAAALPLAISYFAGTSGEAAAVEPAFPAVPSSEKAARTVNPIRGVVEAIDTTGNPDKEMIKFSLGDPTLYGNFPPPESASAVVEAFVAQSANGYVHSAGRPDVRAAIAKASTYEPHGQLTADDVVMTSGGSGAIEMVISALCNPGDNILVPCPGFALYETVAGSLGVESRFYNLDPARNWEADIEQMASLIDANTKAIIVTNPSNPCGSVYSKEHLLDLLALSGDTGVVIVADEIYEFMTFSGVTHHPIGSLSPTVPAISIGGTAKRFCVPGWRVGWIRFYDRNGALAAVRDACFRLAQLILGPNTLIQSAVPALLNTDPAYFSEMNAQLEKQAQFVVARLEQAPGITVIKPSGALYVMCGIDVDAFDDTVGDDMEFTQALLDEQSVFVLPGLCFKYPNYFRVVFAAPMAMLEEGCDRIIEFCQTHHQHQ